VRSANGVSWEYTYSDLCNIRAVSMHAHRLLQAAPLRMNHVSRLSPQRNLTGVRPLHDFCVLQQVK
jgi:hypothetical protein